MDQDGAPAAEWATDLDLFRDLNLDQIIDAIVAGREGYEIRPFFFRPLPSRSAIEYRQAVFRDLDTKEVGTGIREFGRRMSVVRDELERSRKGHYEYQIKRWLVHGAAEYCEAVAALAEHLTHAPIESDGLLRLRKFVAGYVASAAFRKLDQDRRDAADALARITYLIDIRGSHVRVERYHGEANYGEAVARTFEKFRERDAKSYRSKFNSHEDMDHIEAQILERVARLFPGEFGLLDRFQDEHAEFGDPTVLRFDREVQFYLAYLDYLRPIRHAGLTFAYPSVSPAFTRERAHNTFDLALAAKLVADDTQVVTNEFHLDGRERVFVVTGPNQGGKTTFARTVGQLHYLARLGLSVPGEEVELLLCDAIYTHFERPENLHDLVGKLQDDLIRIREILDRATACSIVIMNEIFTSTTLQDARFLSRKILTRLRAIDAVCVCVTFIDELASFDAQTVSTVSAIAQDDPAIRTFKVVRRPADGRAYAQVIAEHYRLTYDAIRERLSS